jgi:hypothetical protein
MGFYHNNVNERQHYATQQQAAQVANYRIAWSQDRGGYFAQSKSEHNGWEDVGKVHNNEVDARLDAKLDAPLRGTTARLYPQIANLTEGRSEYSLDFSRPFPGW